MSAFSEQFREVLRGTDLSQVEISRRTKISQPTISRYLNGEMSPEPEAFGMILDQLPDTLHYHLIRARLSDELPAKYRDTITILSQSVAVGEDATPYRPLNMADDLRKAVEYLANEDIQSPNGRQLLIALADSLGLQK
jgi:transcriptional regulator with XRE-family HTH domain